MLRPPYKEAGIQSAIIPMAPRFSLKKILVATDLSSASSSLLPIAAPLARRLGSEVILVHVLSNASVSPENTVFSPEMSEESAKQKIAELLHESCGDDLRIHGRLRRGEAATQIADLARTEGIDLVITGTHGRRGFRHFLIGSVCEEIFRRVRCPVLTIGPHVRVPEPARKVGRILFPTDLSAESLNALPYACAIAREFDAQLLLLHVLPPETASNPETRKLGEPLLARMKEVTSAYIQPSCQSEFILRSGREAETIQAVAKDNNVGLIVLGLRAGSAGGSLHSTIAYKIIAEANCPVLTVRSAS
jgi:nucleotide-binding universal stress UspA family protein